MESGLAKKLEYANKLIFVERYSEAERILEDLLAQPDAANELLIHLRRIELAAKLGKLKQLHQQFIDDLQKSSASPNVEICLLMTEQLGSLSSTTEIIQRFQNHMQEHGPSAAAYYGIAFTLEGMGNYDRSIYNYQQSLALDSSWYPSYFGLSQIYYFKQDEAQGDHYFYLFESAAPFNVYGNFETHRKLYQEFLELERYEEAEMAISTLSDWWIDNKGHCPPEIQVYELLATAKVARLRGDERAEQAKREQARRVAKAVLASSTSPHGVYFFLARALEDHDESALALEFYKQALKSSRGDPQIVQRIGSQFLSLGEYELARQLFQEAYESFPDNPDIRFCLLVAKLKLAGVNVEDYLIGKERLRQLVQGGGDKVELLSLLHALMSKFPHDSEVQLHVGETYLRLGNVERASRHFQQMYQLDPQSPRTALKYASFIMQHEQQSADSAAKILQSFSEKTNLPREMMQELHWLQAQHFANKRNFTESNRKLRQVLRSDPWNVSYIVRDLLNRALETPAETAVHPDPVLLELSANLDQDVDWAEFDVVTEAVIKEQQYELAYLRLKLRFLFEGGTYSFLSSLTDAAAKWNPKEGINDLLRLINTNFDAPGIYWAIGTLYKDLWQLQAASTWFEYLLNHPEASQTDQARAYLDLADTFLWQGIDLEKAVEYARLAIDLGAEEARRAEKVLAHALLAAGRVREAQSMLENMSDERDLDAVFLRGLLQYRNGATQRAKEVWKPVLTMKSESLRSHNIKQEIMRFYFANEPYLKAN